MYLFSFKRCKSAQATFEFIIIFSLFMAMILIVMFYSTRQIKNYIRNNELEDTIKALRDSADKVGSIGPGTRRVVSLKLPDSIEEIYTVNNNIILISSERGEESDIHFNTEYHLFGFFESTRGNKYSIVKAEENNHVSIAPLGYPELVDDITAYYDFEYDNSTHTFDSSGNSNAAEFINGSYTAKPGYIGKGAKLNGSNYISAGDTCDMGLNDFTVSAWFYLNDFKNNYSGIVSKSKRYGALGGWWIILNNSDSSYKIDTGFGVSTTEFERLNSPGSITLNQWHHVASTWDKDENLTLYYDGKKINTTDISQYKNLSFDTNHPLYIGVYQNATGDGPYNNSYTNGTIDEVIIWNRSLSSDEVSKLYILGRSSVK